MFLGAFQLLNSKICEFLPLFQIQNVAIMTSEKLDDPVGDKNDFRTVEIFESRHCVKVDFGSRHDGGHLIRRLSSDSGLLAKRIHGAKERIPKSVLIPR